MMQAVQSIRPETWKAIGDYAGKAWAALGPLVGVLIGAWLGRAWDSKKWEKENRKEECRELIKIISHAATIILNTGSGSSGQEAHEAYLDSIKTFHDRIFIADEVEKAKILDSWVNAVNELGARTINAAAFGDRVDDVRKTIIGLVISK